MLQKCYSMNKLQLKQKFAPQNNQKNNEIPKNRKNVKILKFILVK